MSFGRALIDSRRVIQEAGILPGMHVADFGCGRSAHFILPMQDAVGDDGHVYAVDIVQDHLGAIHGHCAMRGASNVTCVWGDFERVGGVAIPEKSLDTIFVVNTLPLIRSQVQFAQETSRLLKEGGSLILIDWKLHVPHPVAPPPASRIGMAEAEAMFARLGWQKSDEVPISSSHWGTVLTYLT